MRSLSVRSLPILLAASLLVGAIAFAPPAGAKPCYEDGQPAPGTGAPDPNRMKDACQAALTKLLDIAQNGYFGSYGPMKLQERLVYHTVDESNRNSFLSCTQRTLAVFTCTEVYGRGVLPDVDKGVMHYTWVCYFAQAGFAPTPPATPSLPLVGQPAVPLVLACFPSALYGLAYAGVGTASPDLQKQLPAALSASYVGSAYVWPNYHKVLSELNELP